MSQQKKESVNLNIGQLKLLSLRNRKKKKRLNSKQNPRDCGTPSS